MSSVSDPAAKEEVQEGMKTMWERQKSRAERLIHTVFPAKALELDTLLKEKFAKAPPEIVEEVVVTPMDDSASASAAAGTEPGAKRAKLDEQHASGQVLAYDTKGRHGQAGGHVLLRELAAVVRNEVYQMIDNINAVRPPARFRPSAPPLRSLSLHRCISRGCSVGCLVAHDVRLCPGHRLKN